MAKFSTAVAGGTSVLRTSGIPTVTYEGASGYKFTDETELLLLAATNLVGENTFYQSADEKDKRYRDLIHKITQANPAFIAGNETRQGLASYLRRELRMRTASVVMAAEYIRAGGQGGRKVVSSVLQRADEPSELLGYWIGNYGRRIPQPIKRGIADALPRLWNESSVMKYDSSRHAVRFADVVELVHPVGGEKSNLYRYLLDERHGHALDGNAYALPMVQEQQELEKIDPAKRLSYLDLHGMPRGWSWERLSGYVGPMNAKAWELAIPNMGVMALLRNLRNFDEAGISDDAVEFVIAKITNPDDVAASRIWPLNVYAAYKESKSDNWKRALGKTLDLTSSALPELDKSTLILVDVSGSMYGAALSRRSTLPRAEAAGVGGAGLATKSGGRLGAFASIPVEMQYHGFSTLNIMGGLANAAKHCGGGTDTARAVRESYHNEKRVIVITDEQTSSSYAQLLPQNTFLHVFDLAGYGRASMEFGQSKRFVYGGFSDSLLALLPIVERGASASWPF